MQPVWILCLLIGYAETSPRKSATVVLYLLKMYHTHDTVFIILVHVFVITVFDMFYFSPSDAETKQYVTVAATCTKCMNI